MIHTPFNKQAKHNRCNCHSHRCYSGHRAGHDAALCSWSGHKHSHAGFLSGRYPHENVEDAHPAPHHLQSHHRSVLNHMCCVLSESESEIRPSMVTHTRNLCSAINPSKVHTHSSEHTHTPWTHTHTVNTHPEQWAAIYAAAPGEQLRFGALLKGISGRGIEGGESAVHSLPPPTIPAGPRLETRNLWITSPTL